MLEVSNQGKIGASNSRKLSLLVCKNQQEIESQSTLVGIIVALSHSLHSTQLISIKYSYGEWISILSEHNSKNSNFFRSDCPMQIWHAIQTIFIRTTSALG